MALVDRSRALQVLRPRLAGHPWLRGVLRQTDTSLSRVHHSLAGSFPGLIKPQPRQLTVAITAACNLRCIGCRYGRDFMLGARLSLEMAKHMLDDAKAAGVSRVRLYGGEPLVHPDVTEMIRHSTSIGLDTYITSNALLLGDKIDELFEAGLRLTTIGFYGVGAKYDEYSQRKGQFEKLERSLSVVREKYGSRFDLQLNYVILRPMCNLEALHGAWEFARRFDMHVHVDLYAPTFPYFTDGPDKSLAFAEEDRGDVQRVVDELVRLKEAHPQRIPHSTAFLRSIPDWVILGPDMRVPCDAYQLIWVGADGTVQLCDVHFKLGNLHDRRLRDMLFSAEHKQACVDGFLLKCPNCTCKVDTRIQKHAPSMRRYG